MILELMTNFDKSVLLYTTEDIEVTMERFSREAMRLCTLEIQKAAESGAGVALGEFYVFNHGLRKAEALLQEQANVWGFKNFVTELRWIGGSNSGTVTVQLDIQPKDGIIHPFQFSKLSH